MPLYESVLLSPITSVWAQNPRPSTLSNAVSLRADLSFSSVCVVVVCGFIAVNVIGISFVCHSKNLDEMLILCLKKSMVFACRTYNFACPELAGP